MEEETKKSYLSSDIKTVMALIVVFVVISVGLYLIDIKTNYLTSLAARLMSGIR